MTRCHAYIRLNHRASTLHGELIAGPDLAVSSSLISCRKANAIGRSSKTVREFLERNHKDDMDREETIKLTIKSLLEVVQTGAKNIELAVISPGKSIEMLPLDQIESYVKIIEEEKKEEDLKKKSGKERVVERKAG